MNVEYTVQIWNEGNQFIAHAMPLDVMSSGRSPEDARRAVDEAVHLFLITAQDMGTLEEVLQEAGYKLHDGRWISPAFVLSPLAVDVYCDDDSLSVQLSDGRKVSVPLGWSPRLFNAAPEQRQKWELIGQGEGIHWEDVDEDISVASLLGLPSD